ncbi:hypothetical protein PybrP1_006048 [[Pythium] brassicae (nom. inval.)]|nr:hypothetical protein PybrP1_006048 [[Pythium] brassicae (nom. inval.)]
MQLLRVALCAVAALALAVEGATKNGTMSVGDGTTVTAKGSTAFLGTEYNPDTCVLQFSSLKCSNKDCGELNGYPLECVNVGKQNGVDKKICQCRANETDACQNSTMPGIPGSVPQFGDCSDNKQCVDSYGHVSSKLELRICAEKVHCVKEINTNATKPASICHTCRSCIQQNDESSAKLVDVKRFNCTAICPPEIIESLAKRNKAGVGIADDLTSVTDSGSGSGSTANEASGSGGNKSASSQTGAGKQSAAVAVSPLSLVAALVVATVSLAIMS